MFFKIFSVRIEFRTDINTEAQVKPTIFLFQSTIKTTTLFRQKETSHKTWLVFLYNREVFFFSSRTCIVVSPSNATSMLLVISFALCAIFVFYVTSSPCRPSAKFHVFCMQFQSQGQLKVILLLRGKRCALEIAIITIILF